MVRARRCGWWCRPKPLEPPLPAVHPPPSGSGRMGQRRPSSHNPPSPEHRFAPPGRAEQPACRQGASVRPAPTLRVPCALWSTDPAISNGRCPHRWVLNAWRPLTWKRGWSHADGRHAGEAEHASLQPGGEGRGGSDGPDPACGVGDRARDGAAGLAWVRRKELSALPPPRTLDSATG
jgi:hypothetical protein